MSSTNSFKGVQTIGIVDLDNVRLGPVAQVILNRTAVESKNATVRGMKFYTAGYKRTVDQAADSAKSYLQTHGFGNAELLKPVRLDKNWLRTKDLIIVTEPYLRDKILFDFFPTTYEEWEKKIGIINEMVGISDVIRDPGPDPLVSMKPIYELLERCCKEIIKKLEMSNK